MGKHLVVGAGVTGGNCALTLKESGLEAVIYEKDSKIGGTWETLANRDSTVQVDSIVWKPNNYQEDRLVDHDINEDPFVGFFTKQSEVIEQVQDAIDRSKSKVIFNRIVLSWKKKSADSDTIIVTSKDTKTNEQFVEEFDGLHIRIGTLINPRKTTLKGEEKFKGKIATGCEDDLNLQEFKGKNVVIIGNGAFAIDNVGRALKNGAKHVTVLARRKRLHLFQSTIYKSREFLNPASADPKVMDAVWKVYAARNREMAKALGVEDLIMEEGTCIKNLDGYDHFIYSGSLGCGRFDITALGIHYGLVDFLIDETEEITENQIITKNEKKIDCDLLIKCFGFSAGQPDLIKKHVIVDNLWVDGLKNVTSVCGHDHLHGTKYFGPKISGTSVFLISYNLFVYFEKVICFFLANPEIFAQFKALPVFQTFHPIENIDIEIALKCFTKVFAFGNQQLMGEIVPLMIKKCEMWERLMNQEKFNELDKNQFETISKIFAEKAGAKEVFKYPEEKV